MPRKAQQGVYATKKLAAFSGGLNTDDPVVVADEDLVEATNIEYTNEARIKMRPGMSKRFASDFDSNPVIGMSPYYKSDGTTRLVMAAGTSLYADKPHVVFNYDAQADWKQAGVYTNLDVDSVPGDVRMLEVMVDGFEDGTFNWWTTRDSGWTIDTTVYKTGTRSAKGTGTNQKMVRNLGLTTSQLYVKLAVRFAETNAPHYPVILLTPSGAQAQVVVADADGSFKYFSGTALTTFPTTKTYVANTWYVVEVWVRGGTFWVSIDGQSLTTAGLALRDTSNNAVTQVAKVQVQNAGATAATMWVDDVIIDPLAAVFSRASTATKQDGTTVVGVNQPRFEDIKKTYTEDTQADFQAGTLTDVVATAAGDLKLAQEGVDCTNTATLTADFNGTHSNTQASNDAVTLLSSAALTVEYPSTNYDSDTGFGSSETFKALAQGFKVNIANPIVKIGVYMYRRTLSGGGVSLRIVNDNSGVPGTTTYASVNIPDSAFGSYPPAWVEITLSTPWTPTVGTQYWLIATYVNSAGSYAWGSDGSSATYSGGAFATSTDRTTWTISPGYAAIFRIYQTAYATSGTYTHPALDVSGAKTAGSATIVYNTTLPTNTTLTVAVRTSTDGGVTWGNWTPVSSGATIIPKGTNLTNYRVQWQANLSTANTSVTPSLNDVTVTVVSAYKTSGNRTSPAVPVSLPGQAQSSLISWTADVPANTALSVELSWDGGTTWLACTSGQALPGISGLNLQTANFLLRESLSTTDTVVTPVLQSLTVTIASNFGKCLTIQATDGTRAAEILSIPRQALTNVEGSFEKRISLLRTPGTTEQYILDGNGVTNRSLVCVVRTDGKVAVRFGNGSTTYELVGATVLQQGRWYAVGFRWGSSGVALVLNGVLEASTATAPSLALGDILYLGCKADGTCQLDGFIDDFRTSSRARTDTEFQAVYNSNLPQAWDIDTLYLLDFDGDFLIPLDRQGVWVSPVQNASAAKDYASLVVTWQGEVPYNTAIACQVRTSTDGVNWSAWYDQVNGATATAPANPYSQIRFILQELNNWRSPVLHMAAVTYEGQPSVTVLATGLGVSERYSFTQLMDYLIICNMANTPKKYDGATLQDITSAPKAALVCAYKNRVFMAKDGTNRSRLWFSGLANIDDWTSDQAGFIDVNPNDGDEIMALVPTSMTLLVVKQHATYFLQGYSPETFHVTPAGEGGTISPWGMIWTPYGVFRLDREGIWVTDFRKQTLLTRKIQKLWESLNMRAMGGAALLYYKDKLLAAVPSGASNRNDTILVYDLIHKGWSVWSGWYPACLVPFWERGHWAILFGSSASGNVYEIGGPNDAGTPVTAKVTTRHLPLVSEEFLKRVKWADVYFGGGGTSSTVQTQFVVDGVQTAPKTFTVPANADSALFRLFPPPYGKTIGLRFEFSGPAVFQGATFTYFPRAIRPQRVV